MWRKALIFTLIVVTAAVTTVAAAVFGVLWYLDKQAHIRVIRSDNQTEALMAVTADGLRELNHLYALPKTCSEDGYRFTCVPKPLSIMNRERIGIIVMPAGTRGISLSKRFVFPNGRLVAPYPASLFDKARDGIVDVEQIRITEGPRRGLEGWVEAHAMGRVCCAPL